MKPFLIVVLFVLVSQTSIAASTEMRVAVLAFRGDDRALARWDSTMAFLSERIPGYHFVAVPMDLEQLDDAVKAGEVDFAITNSGQYVRVGSRYGLSWLATLKSRRHPGRDNVIGSALVVRADSPYQQFEQLRGQRLGAVDPLAFGGFQIYWGEMIERHTRPKQFFSQIRFSGFPVDRLLTWLAREEVEAIILPACLLESMAAERTIDSSRFRVLDQREPPGYRCRVSSKLYPNWSFSKLERTPPYIAEQVSRVLMQIGPQSQEAIDSQSLGWTAPVSSTGIHQLYQQLNIHPWQEPWWQQTRKWLWQNWYWGMVIIAIMVLGFLHHLWIQLQVNRRSRELQKANDQLRHQQQQLEHAQRVAILGELASDIAHEINQPLAAINSYSEGGLVRLRQSMDTAAMESLLQRIGNEAQRGAEIIQRIRDFARNSDAKRERVELGKLCRDTVSLLDYELKKRRIRLEMHMPTQPLWVDVDPVEIQQLLVNLLRNSIEAITSDHPAPHITLDAQVDSDGMVTITITDNGKGMSEEQANHLFEPFYSGKADGLGLGMAISKRIVQAHHGEIALINSDDDGTRIVCRFSGLNHE